METRIIQVVFICFGAGALIIACAGIVVADRERYDEIRRLYPIQFLIVALVLVPAYLGGAALLLVLIVFVLRAQYEFLVLHGRAAWGGAQFMGYVSAAAMIPVAAYFGWWAAMATAAVALVVIGLTTMLEREEADRRLLGSLATSGIVFPGLFIAFIALLSRAENGFGLIFLVYAVVEINDTCALLAGKLFGRIRIAPKLSPAKTVEGTAAGIVCAFSFGLAVNAYIYRFPLPEAAGAVALIILGGIAGDMVTSILKRRRRQKDFPVLIKGHGGVVDIYDSLIFAAPVFYAYHEVVML